ncbi:MAG: acyl-CoA dehydrogenase domain protein [Nocardioides sp.]|nr:acyl-CoA dehydrogenase domain protein [Nocardioides sp.]
MILREEELETWREVVRSFLERGVVTTDQPAGPRVDRELWRRACAQLGMAGIDVPEELGGSGAGFGALALVQRECGRVLARLPVLGSVVAAQGLVLGAGAMDLLGGLLDGSVVAAAALDAPGVTVTDGRATGQLDRLLDGLSADLLVLVGPDSTIWAVDLGAGGVRRTGQESMDLTRDFARVELADAPARQLGDGPRPDVVALVRQRVAAAVACEQQGGAQRTLEDAVAYTLTRTQFGRVIGSFQALKHRCADLAIEVDLATSAVEHAAWAIQTDAPEAPLAVAMAGSVCGPAFLSCALENVQLHGGIGFTWEHPAHLFVRRAESDLALFGDGEAHRERVLVELGF